MAHSKYTVALNIVLQLSIIIGIKVANMLNYFFAKIRGGWGRCLSLVGAMVAALIVTVGSIVRPETPNSMIEHVDEEFNELVATSDASTLVEHPRRNIMERKYRPPLTMAILMPLFQQLTGIHMIMFYVLVLFKTIGFIDYATLMSAVIICGVNVIATMVSIYGVDKWGRRFLFLVDGVQMLVHQIVVAVFICMKFGADGISNGELEKWYAIVVVLFICIYISGFAWSWGPLGWLVPSEIFPLENCKFDSQTLTIVNFHQELIQTNGFDGTSTNDAVIGGVLILQRCYRGYRARCYVNELKRSAITLQSFIRAEMSIKAYQHLAERLSPNHEARRQNVQGAQSNLLQRQNGAIILLQSAIRGWLTRRHYKNIERVNIVPVETSEDQTTSNPDAMDCFQIPYSTVFELQTRVLKTEATLQERKQQNVDLRKKLKQYEDRWLLYEEKMKSIEKMPEQLTSMQVSLADAAKKKVATKRSTTLYELLQDESPSNIIDSAHPINHQNRELDDEVKLGSRISKKDAIVELEKLESQYGEWEKEYSMRLKDIKSKMKKLSLPPTEKYEKRWWRKPLMGGFNGVSKIKTSLDGGQDKPNTRRAHFSLKKSLISLCAKFD